MAFDLPSTLPKAPPEAINNFQEATGLRVSAVSPQFIDVRGLSDPDPRPILAGVEVELVL